MKYIVMALLMVCFNANAGEIELRKTDMVVEWGDLGDMHVTAYQVGYNHKIGNYGVGILGGQSDTSTENSNKLKITNFWVLTAKRDLYSMRGVTLSAGLTYTEYKSNNLNGVNADTSTGYTIELKNRINYMSSIKISYNNYYEKEKQGLGKEVTKGIGVSLVFDI